jgi:hypothetical protein
MDEAPEWNVETPDPAVLGAEREVGGCATKAAWLGAVASALGFLSDWYREVVFGIDPGFAGGNFAHNFGVVFPLYCLAALLSGPGASTLLEHLAQRLQLGVRLPTTVWRLALPLVISGAILGYIAYRSILFIHFERAY